MISSVKESLQQTSESEGQAVISAQELATALQNEMSQATTSCDSWKSEVMRLRKEVAEQSTKSMARRNSLHYSDTTRNVLFETSPSHKLMKSRSIHPQLNSDWSAELNVEARMEEWTIQKGSCSTNTKWSFRLLLRKSPRNHEDCSGRKTNVQCAQASKLCITYFRSSTSIKSKSIL